ncbi:MAG: caspase family protein [Pseudomonadota bacterium]
MIGLLRRLAGVACICAAATAQAKPGIDEYFRKPPSELPWGKQLYSYFEDQIGTLERSYALVVGISEFDHFADLPTEKDPYRIRDYLLNEAGFDGVWMLTEDQVTPARVRELMEEVVPKKIGRNDTLLFYWSGHGHTELDRGGDNIGYLPTATATETTVSRMVSMDALKLWDRRIRARQVLYLLDSCFSGHAGIVRQSSVRDLTLEQVSQPSRHIMTAGTADQETIASEVWQSSIFTKAILEGLRGAADAQSAFDRDGIVTINELEDYTKKRVNELRHAAGFRRQITPQVWDLGSNDGAFFFVSPTHKTAALERRGRTFEGRFEHGVPMSTAAVAPTRPEVVPSAREPSIQPSDPDTHFRQGRLETIGDWSVFESHDGTTCWAASAPEARIVRVDGEARSIPGEVLLLVTRFKSGAGDQVSIYYENLHRSLPYRVSIGADKRFDITLDIRSSGTFGWALPGEDDAVIDMLVAAEEVSLTADTNDMFSVMTFSANGFTGAWRLVQERCEG